MQVAKRRINTANTLTPKESDRYSRERFRNLQAKADENRNESSTGAFCSFRPLLFLSAAATAADADVVDGEENEDADTQNDGRANPDNDRL